MSLLEKIENVFGKNERPKYSFELVNSSLLRDDRKAIAELITQVDAGQSLEEKMGPWDKLTKLVSDRFEDLSLSPDEDSVSDFIKAFALLPHSQNYTEATPVEASDVRQETVAEVSVIENDSVEMEPVSRVVPTRVKPGSQFDGLEPVAVAPRTPAQKGEDALNALLAESKTVNAEKATEVYKSPYEGDALRHSVQSDEEIINAITKSNSQIPSYTNTIPPSPPKTL